MNQCATGRKNYSQVAYITAEHVLALDSVHKLSFTTQEATLEILLKRDALGAPVGLTITPAITLQADRLSFPGMLPREVLIWKTWLRSHEREYDSFDYNQRIGPGFDPGPAWPENMRVMAIANSKKRMDAVAWKGTLATLVEVKDRAGASALGQLLTYYPLWTAAHSDLPRPNMLLVTNRIQPGIDIAAGFHGVSVAIVPTDFSSLARDRRASPFMAKQIVIL